MKVKTQNLIDHALDWAVAKCEDCWTGFTETLEYAPAAQARNY